MPHATVTIPAEHAAGFRRSLLELYAVKAESIHFAADEYLRDEAPLAALLEHRAEMAEVDRLIAQFGWDDDEPGETSLSGERSLLQSLVVSTLADGFEALTDLLPHATDPSVDVPAARQRLAAAETLLSLAEQLTVEGSHL